MNFIVKGVLYIYNCWIIHAQSGVPQNNTLANLLETVKTIHDLELKTQLMGQFRELDRQTKSLEDGVAEFQSEFGPHINSGDTIMPKHHEAAQIMAMALVNINSHQEALQFWNTADQFQFDPKVQAWATNNRALKDWTSDGIARTKAMEDVLINCNLVVTKTFKTEAEIFSGSGSAMSSTTQDL